VIRLSEVIGNRVVARDTAETVGEVRGVVVDAASRRVAALLVGKGRRGRVVDWESLSGVGPDAVVVSAEDGFRDPRSPYEERSVKADIFLLRALVLSDRGNALGEVADVEIDEATGELSTVVVGEEAIDAGRLLAVGGYATVVTEVEAATGGAGAEASPDPSPDPPA
jgi:sporulation protein YlmC with PRC-barrel domain